MRRKYGKSVYFCIWSFNLERLLKVQLQEAFENSSNSSDKSIDKFLKDNSKLLNNEDADVNKLVNNVDAFNYSNNRKIYLNKINNDNNLFQSIQINTATQQTGYANKNCK